MLFKQYLLRVFSLLALFSISLPGWTADYTQRDDVQQFIDNMVTEHGFDAQQLQGWLSEAEKKQNIIDAISRPAEKTKPWKDYRKIFVTDTRTQQGVQFWQENADILKDVSMQYGVDEEIIVAIIGVETRYGRNTGSYRVIDALSTLGFDYEPRAKFFRKQLEEFFLLTREQGQDPLVLKGSYAGAMGYGQFIPSSYRHYAVDYDGDGFADIWSNTGDAIASVANYFKEHGWTSGEPVIVRSRVNGDYDDSVVNQSLKPKYTYAELQQKGFAPVEPFADDEKLAVFRLEGEMGAEFWTGAKNFYVITRYNHSKLYALSVYQLSQDLRDAYDQVTEEVASQ